MILVRIVPRHSHLPHALPALLYAACTVAWQSSAKASAWDVYGFGPDGIAAVSARAASATDGTASYYNPGGLAFSEGSRVALSAAGVASALEIQGKRQAIADPVGLCASIDTDVPLQGPLAQRLRVGLGLHALPTSLMRLQLHRSTMPFFPYYDARTQRLTAIPAVSFQPIEGLGIGLGANVLAKVSGPIDVREGQSRALETILEQNAGTVVSWIAGIRFDPHRRLHFGLVYRQAFGVPFRVTTTANVAGIPLVVEVSAAQALYDPASLVFGAAVAPTDRLHFEVDGAWHRWSAWKGPLMSVDTTVSALSLSSKSPLGLFQDSVGVRASGTWWLERTLSRETAVIGGLGYETSMLDPNARQGRTNFVDGAKTSFGAGLSVLFPALVGRGLRLSLGGQAQHLAQFSQAKQACTSVPCPAGTVVGPDTEHPDQGIDNAGYPALAGGGTLLVVSGGAEVAW